MSGSYSSRLRAGEGGGGGGLAATTVLAAKVAFASAALAAVASLARVAVPHLMSGADAFLWKLCLFVTVHIIIFVIWKLSDNKHFHGAAHKDPWAPTPHHPSTPLLTEEVVLSAMKRKVDLSPPAVTVRDEEAYRASSPVSRPHRESGASPVKEEVVSPGSCGGESCVTTESEEDANSSAVAATANVATADIWRSVEPAPTPVPKRAVIESAPPTARERAVVEPASKPVRKRAVIESAPPPARERAVVKPAPTPVRKRAVIESAPLPARERAVVEPAPPPVRERAVVERVVSLPPPAAIVATDEHFDGADQDDDGSGDDDLDATWNAIMQKTRPATAPALSSSSARAPRSSSPAPSPRPRAREPSVSADELNKRSEDFIKKIHHSFGRQQ